MMARGRNLAGRLTLMLVTAAATGAAPDANDPAASGPATPAAEISTNTPVALTAPSTAPRAVPKPRPRLSPEITGQISSSLPAWKKPPSGPADKAPPPPPAPDVVRMAPVIVNAYRIPDTAEKEWLTPKGRAAALVKQYLSPLDRDVLNRFTIPLLTMSNEARARMMYEEDKRLEDLKWINDEIDDMQRVDPQAAKEMQQIRDATFTRREP